MSKVSEYDKVKKFFNEERKKGLSKEQLKASFDKYMAKLSEEELTQLEAEYNQVQRDKAINKSVSFGTAS